MDDYPRWDELGAADRLRIAALEAEAVGLAERFLDAMHASADMLEQLQRGERGWSVVVSTNFTVSVVAK